MWQIFGKFKETSGTSVYKAILLREVGNGRFRRIAKHYYGLNEKFWKYDKSMAYELHPENTVEEIGQTRIQYIDYSSGAPVEMLKTGKKSEDVTLRKGPAPVHSPTALFHILGAEHIKQAGKSVLAGNTNLIMCLLCVGVGIAIGFIVGQNLPAITGAFTPGPTPTPTPHFGGLP